MAKIFEIDFRKITKEGYLEKQGIEGPGTTPVKTEKGIAGSFINSSLNYYVTKDDFDGESVKSAIIWFRFTNYDGASTQLLCSGGNSQKTTIGLHKLRGGILTGKGTLEPNYPFRNNCWYQVILNYEIGLSKGWINNRPCNITVGANWSNPPTKLMIGIRRSSSPQGLYGDVVKIEFFDHELTDQEREQDWVEFKKLNLPLDFPTSNFHYPKPKESKEDGLIAHYNMQRVGNVLPDISGNGFDGVIEKDVFQKGTCLRSVSQNACADVPPIIDDATVWGVHLRIGNLKAVNVDFILGGESNRNFCLNPYLAYRATDALYSNFNGAGTSEEIPKTFFENGLCSLTITSDGTHIYAYIDGKSCGYVTPFNTKLQINMLFGGYRNNTLGAIIDYEELKFYDRLLTQEDASSFHNKYADQINLLESFEFEPTDTGQKVIPKGWTRQSGSFNLKSENGENYIEARQANSRIYKKLDNLDTFTLDFDSRKSTNNVFLKLYLLDHYDKDKGKGYITGVGFRELMYTNNNGSESILWRTGARPRLENVWYSYRFTRDAFGEMAMYIKNDKGVYELIYSEDTGTNPITNTNYQNLNYFIISCESAGDSVKNIKITKGVSV